MKAITGGALAEFTVVLRRLVCILKDAQNSPRYYTALPRMLTPGSPLTMPADVVQLRRIIRGQLT
jgi:hypothetical protein